MLEERLRLDVAAVARRTSEGRQAGQDLDEALLHACKEVHGDRGVAAFGAMRCISRSESEAVRIAE